MRDHVREGPEPAQLGRRHARPCELEQRAVEALLLVLHLLGVEVAQPDPHQVVREDAILLSR